MRLAAMEFTKATRGEQTKGPTFLVADPFWFPSAKELCGSGYLNGLGCCRGLVPPRS